MTTTTPRRLSGAEPSAATEALFSPKAQPKQELVNHWNANGGDDIL